MLPPVFPPSLTPSLLLAKLVPVSVYSSAISHLPNSTFLPAFTPPLFPGTRIIVSWVGQPQLSPYPRIEQGRSGKGERGPSPERHLPSMWGPMLLLHPPPLPDSQRLLVLVAAHGSPRWHRRRCLHTDACVCLCMPVCMFGLQWPPGPLSITLLGSHGVESGHQCQIIGSCGGSISPHPSSRQRGRGEGGVNLPTALLIAHMPGHQEPAVTVETISTPPSPRLHGVGLRQGIKHPPTHLSLLPFSLCLPFLHLSLFPSSV